MVVVGSYGGGSGSYGGGSGSYGGGCSYGGGSVVIVVVMVATQLIMRPSI